MVKYDEFSNHFYCREHNITFSKKSFCPKCKSLPPSFPIENDISKGDNNVNFTSNSQAITSNSQGVLKRRYIRKVKDSIYERFHNYGVKFVATIEWDSLFKFEEYHLNNHVSYKRIDFPEAIVKVFKKSILVTLRSSKEIIGLNVKEAEYRSKLLINQVLDRLPKSIQVLDRSIVNVHNAFVNHPYAKRDVQVRVNGELRFISDNSKGHSEFEAINPEFAIPDSEAIEKDVVSLIDKGLSREVLASSINELIKDRGYYAENLKSHVEAIKTLSQSVKEFTSEVKKDRVNKLKHKWGW